MKNLIVVSFLLLIFNNVFTQNLEIDENIVIEIVNKIISKKDVDIYISKKTLDINSTISTMFLPIKSPKYVCWFVFVDEYPQTNWWHNCKYIFINANTQKYETLNMSYPPELEGMKVIKRQKFKKNGELFDLKLLSKDQTKSSFCSKNQWAVIISGGYNVYSNYERYWNDCSTIYSTLINIYGYAKSNIFVLMSDGTDPAIDRSLIDGNFDSSPLDLDGDGINDIQYSATKTNINYVFNTLANTLGNNDNLFIYTTDHGGQTSDKNAHMYLWEGLMFDYELAKLVNKIKAHVNIVMEQCYSGGFLDDLQLNNRIIATSCNYNEISHATSNLLYDEFVYYWTSAVMGKKPTGVIVDADYDGDGFISMIEAFTYAKNNDQKDETPQYYSSPASIGQDLSLGGLIPRVKGTTPICASGATFVVNNFPLSSTTSWNYSTNLTLSSISDSLAVFTPNGTGYGSISAVVNTGCGIINIPSKTVWVGKPSMPYTVPNRGVDMAVNEEIKISLTSTPGSTASTGYWWATGVLYPSTSQYGNSCFFDATSTGHGSVYVTTTNQCGTSTTFQIPILVQETGGGTYTISPNPASSEVTVDIAKNSGNIRQTTSNSTDEPVSIRSIKVFDQQGNMVVFESYNNSSNAVLSVSSLRKGIYIVLINDSEKHTMIKE